MFGIGVVYRQIQQTSFSAFWNAQINGAAGSHPSAVPSCNRSCFTSENFGSLGLQKLDPLLQSCYPHCYAIESRDVREVAHSTSGLGFLVHWLIEKGATGPRHSAGATLVSRTSANVS
ncbi:hypothetical protein BDR07DRAFT_1403113 [Suillus spraguei]|nr:hypothetical protein BDR07DRAFT_1403113 [Suillus spraguei]